MSDYLHDPNADPATDPQVEALERALAPLRFAGGDAPERVLAASDASGPQPERWRWGLAVAVAAAAAVALWMLFGEESARDALQPAAAARTFVAQQEALTIPLGDLATITLDEGSELEFLHWRDDEARFHLRRGRMTAKVQPPPVVQRGFFVVDVPLGSVVDQGCQYELNVRPDGFTNVRVTEGAVTFAETQFKMNRLVFVPAGASARMTNGRLSIPTFLEMSPRLKKTLQMFESFDDEPDAQMRVGAARKLVAMCEGPPDTLILWHLLYDEEYEIQKIATGELLRLVGPPDGSTEMRMYQPDEWLPFLRSGPWQMGG